LFCDDETVGSSLLVMICTVSRARSGARSIVPSPPTVSAACRGAGGTVVWAAAADTVASAMLRAAMAYFMR